MKLLGWIVVTQNITNCYYRSDASPFEESDFLGFN